MCKLCEDDDPSDPSIFEHCCCIKCGVSVCYDGGEGLAEPCEDWHRILYCRPCDEADRDAEIAASARDES